MNLRPYQTELIQAVKKKFASGKKRVILCAPTGAGKTVIFTKVVIDTLNKSLFNRVLIVTDRIELFKQTFKSLNKAGAEPVLYQRTDVKLERCVVAMIETLKRRYKAGKLDIGNFDLIIIDEAHKGNFKGLFDIYPNAYYIGATATPLTTSKKDPLKNYYDDCVMVVDTPDLIQQGFLNPARSVAMVAYNEEDLQIDYRKGDFTDKSLAEAFSKPAIYKGLQDMYDKHAKGKKSIIFCVNVDETVKVARQFNAFYVHSKLTKEERNKQLAGFHNSKDGIMVNCGILTTGYDHPAIEAIIINRATTSLPLFLQICGRGSRLYEGKTHFTICDLGGNITRLGFWEDQRDWIDWFRNPPKPGQLKPGPVRTCKGCEALLPARTLICPYCGHEHEVEEKEQELLEGEMVVLRKLPDELKNRYIGDLSPSELLTVIRLKGYKPGLAKRICAAKGERFAIEYAKLAGYKKGWVHFLKQTDKEFKNFKIV